MFQRQSPSLANAIKHRPKIQRDYWSIEAFGSLGTSSCGAVVRGRRRQTESFWPGLRLTWDALIRFSVTMRNAVVVADGFLFNQEQSSPCIFPNSETLAICQGSDYVIETSECLNGFGKRSIGTTIFRLGEPILPTVHVIDDELRQFSSDVERIIEHLGDTKPIVTQ